MLMALTETLAVPLLGPLYCYLQELFNRLVNTTFVQVQFTFVAAPFSLSSYKLFTLFFFYLTTELCAK